MRARPSLVALLALSRQTRVAAGASRHASRSAVHCAARALAPNADRRTRFQIARIRRLALRSARAVRPAAASARSCRIEAEEPQQRHAVPGHFGPAVRAAHVAMLFHRKAMQGRCSPSRGLTLPSSGQPKAGFACFCLPLMSNVGRLERSSGRLCALGV